jgi:group II intron reverse transcriptase/maturase
VSAELASPTDRKRDVVPRDKVRALQHTLYRAAKADPGRRFHTLWDKVLRRDVLWRGWVAVRRNDGASGIDKLTLDAVEEYGIDRFLTEIQSELREGQYRPLPARQVLIPKPGAPGQTRPLAIASVRDRVVQAALKIVFEPIFEADFLPCSFGFRPRRSAHDALHVLDNEAQRGRRWVVETDIANCFDAIPKDQLIHAVQERVCDQSVLKLLRVVLGAGVMTADGQVRRSVTGTPQGGPLSPLLCNAYLHQLDRVWSVREHGVLVRYCDDLVVMCRSREQAETALTRLSQLLAQLGLQLKQAKTRIVRLEVGGPGFDFLGFHHRLMRSRGIRGRRGVTFLARWPSDKAMRHARDRLRALTRSSRLLLPVEAIVGDMNMFLRGWGAYFRYGHSAARFTTISHYALERLALFVGKRHKRGRRYGLSVVAYLSPNRCGLVNLSGTVVTPRAGTTPWREKLNADGERRR